jgi:hypothetical protein
MRRRLSYANVVATLALVFAMSGGALAANHYLINSTKQISPKVLKKLTGKTGKTGVDGAAGAAGKEGPQGKEGSAGKEGKEGLAGAAGIGPAFSVFHEASIEWEQTSELRPVLSLTGIPAGSYWITATFGGFNVNTGHTSKVDASCTLSAGADSDIKHFDLGDNELSEDGNADVAMQLVHQFTAAGGVATLECDNFAVKGISLEDIKITAIQISAITNKAG